VLASVFLAACGGIDIEVEHKLRMGADCPDPEAIGLVRFALRGGGDLTCTRIRVVSGPPYRGATYLECVEPDYGSPRERRGEKK
jgi:hypothetical protein